MKSDIIKVIESYSRDLSIDLIRFGALPSKYWFLREENRDYLWENHYRWCISLAMEVSQSATDLLALHNDPGMMWYFESHYFTVADMLEEAAQKLALKIESLGYRSFVIPGRKKAYKSGEFPGIISHLALARLTGVGSIGDSGSILTREFGPRIRLSSIVTTLPLPTSENCIEDYCLHCGRCRNNCPSGAILGIPFDPENPDNVIADGTLCVKYKEGREKDLGTKICNCCQQVCPVGSKILTNLTNNESNL